MNFRSLFVFVFLAIGSMAFAQSKGILKGVVIDKVTGETLPNASVNIVGTTTKVSRIFPVNLKSGILNPEPILLRYNL